MIGSPADYGLHHAQWRPAQLDLIIKCKYHIENGDNTIIASMPTGCHLAGQKILMYDGSVKNVEDIQVGEQLMGWDNKPRTVLSLVSGVGDMYKIIPIKGDPFVVNEDHILTLVRTNYSKTINGKKYSSPKNGNIIDVSLGDYILWSNEQRHLHKLFRVSANFVGQDSKLPLDPYFLGILLGDGSFHDSIKIFASDKEIISSIYQYAKLYKVDVSVFEREGKICKTYVFKQRDRVNPVINGIRSLGLFGKKSGTKFIPDVYKISSLENRLSILAGVLDTDGYLNRNCIDYVTKSKALADDVAFIARSVGLSATVHKCMKSCQTGATDQYFRMSICGDIDIIPFRVARRIPEKRQQKKNVLRTGFSIEYYGVDKYYGFSIDGDGRFLLGDFTVTHNTGKSSVSATLAKDSNVLVLVHTLSLLKQYELEYGFDIVKGMQEYDCAHKSKSEQWRTRYHRIPKASDCHFSNMFDCKYADKCAYLNAKAKAIASNKCACTYRYGILSEEIQKREGILVMDECHQASDEILSLSEFIVTADQCKEFDFPPYPVFGIGGGLGDLMSSDTRTEVLSWLGQCAKQVEGIDIFDYMSPDGAKKMKMFKYLESGIEMLASDQDLFIFCGDRVVEENLFEKRTETQLMFKPIESHILARKLYSGKSFTLMMSATIGNPAPLARELGFENYIFYDYPHPTPKKARPVRDLKVERMTKDNLDRHPELYKIQAIAIANWIKELPADWRGIVLTTSNFKVKLLRQNLEELLPGRIFKSSSPKVEQRVKDFTSNTRQGLVAVETIQGWGTGLDFFGDMARFSVVAGVPYPNPTDKYHQVRVARQGGYVYSMWRTMNTIPQACGRVSRGEKEGDKWMMNMAALADGSCVQSQAMIYYPSWFKEAIV